MAGMKTSQNRDKKHGKRTASEANLEDGNDEYKPDSKRRFLQNSDENVLSTVSPPHEPNCKQLPTTSTMIYLYRRGPFLPGTQCQPRQSGLSHDQNDDSACQPVQHTMVSPEFGITLTPVLQPHSNFMSRASGVESISGDETELIEVDDECDLLPVETGTAQTHKNSAERKNMQKFFQRQFCFLKQELMPKDLANRLFNDQVIGIVTIDEIKDAPGRRKKCDILIKAIIHSLNTREEDCVRKIKYAFEKENYGHVFDEFEKYSASALCADTDDEQDIFWKERLDKFGTQMEDELDPRYFIDDLVSEEVLELDEHQNILEIPFKPKKIKSLIKYLKRKTREKFDNFCTVIKRLYPNSDVADQLVREQPSMNKEQADVNVLRSVSISLNEEHSCRRTSTMNTNIKLKLEGNAQDIERMIVEENSTNSNDSLQEEAMEFAAYEVLSTQFSSIRIVLSALSKFSEMRFIEKCRQSPIFLQKILQSLIKEKHFQQLKEKNIKHIMFEIEIQWPNSKITTQDIEANLPDLEKTMTKEDILRVLNKVKGSEKTVEDCKQTQSSRECFRLFIAFLLDDINETAVETLVEDLKQENKKEILEELEKSRIRRDKENCCCELKKETIVAHFSLIEKEMIKVREIVEKFSEFPGFDLDVQGEIRRLLDLESTEQTTDAFLRKLLELPVDGVQLCLLEEQLYSTGQNSLLELVKESKTDEDVKELDITTDDLTGNWSFLCDELEPKQYINMLKDIDETDSLCERILAATSREERCRIMLTYICNDCRPREKKQVLLKFQREFKKINPELIRYIMDAKSNRVERSLKESIIRSYKHIVEEVEPRSILKFFEERKQISINDRETINNASSRRARAIKLMNYVLKGSETKVRCLFDALRCVGYVSLVKTIETYMKPYEECPRLYHAFHNKECFKFKGELEIDFLEKAHEDSQPSKSEHMFLNWSVVTNRVPENYFADERDNQYKEENKSSSNEQALNGEQKEKKAETRGSCQRRTESHHPSNNQVEQSSATCADPDSEHLENCFKLDFNEDSHSPSFGLRRNDDMFVKAQAHLCPRQYGSYPQKCQMTRNATLLFI